MAMSKPLFSVIQSSFKQDSIFTKKQIPKTNFKSFPDALIFYFCMCIKHIFMLSISSQWHLVRHSATEFTFKDTQRVLKHLEYSESTWTLGHLVTWRALEGHSGTRALNTLGNSGSWALKALKHLDIRAFGHLGHLGTWSLGHSRHLDTRTLWHSRQFI